MAHGNEMFETLENRTLMSASPFNKTIDADRHQVRADFLKFHSDVIVAGITASKDLATIKADHPSDMTTLRPLIAQLHRDNSAMANTLTADRLNEKANVLADESVVVRDRLQVLRDRKTPAALATDKTKLHTDQAKLQTDMIAGLDARIGTREAAMTTLTTDLSAIVSAVQSDPNSSTKLIADASRFANDRSASLNAMSSDLQSLVIDRIQLADDLTASNSTT